MQSDHSESIIFGYVNPPAGHVEIGETIDSAVRRELKEETGLENIANIKVRGFINVKGFKDSPVFMIVVSATISDDSQPILKDEGTPVWIFPRELKSHKVLEDVEKIITLAQKTPEDEIFQVASECINRKLVSFHTA